MSDNIRYATVTIVNGASLSSAASLEGGTLLAVLMPAAWTAAGLSFQVSYDGANYYNLQSTNAEYTATAAASQAVALPVSDFLAVRNLKVRSGTATVPVNQLADRILTIVWLAD